MNKKLCLSGLGFALGTVAYIALVATFMNNAEKMMGSVDDKFFAPIVFLTLLVVSAAITSSLVFGKPVMLYLDGSKKDAVKQLASTIAWLVVCLIVTIVIVVLSK